jgi:hypothetical protein
MRHAHVMAPQQSHIAAILCAICVCITGNVADWFSLLESIGELTIYHDLAVQNALIGSGHEQLARRQLHVHLLEVLAFIRGTKLPPM